MYLRRDISQRLMNISNRIYTDRGKVLNLHHKISRSGKPWKGFWLWKTMEIGVFWTRKVPGSSVSTDPVLNDVRRVARFLCDS